MVKISKEKRKYQLLRFKNFKVRLRQKLKRLNGSRIFNRLYKRLRKFLKKFYLRTSRKFSDFLVSKILTNCRCTTWLVSHNSARHRLIRALRTECASKTLNVKANAIRMQLVWLSVMKATNQSRGTVSCHVCTSKMTALKCLSLLYASLPAWRASRVKWSMCGF